MRVAMLNDGTRSWAQRGQGSVEYALVLLAFIASLVALSALWHAGRDGALLRRAIDAASHSMGSGFVAGSKDLLLY